MSKEFDEIISRLNDVRANKKSIKEKIYAEQQIVVTNQYLLEEAVNHNQKGEKYLEAIQTHSKNVGSLKYEAEELGGKELELVKTIKETYKSFENTVNELNDQFPILFFPVRIETAFSDEGKQELWVRIFPDDIAVDSHEEDLTESEIAEGIQFWEQTEAAQNETEAVHAWDLLCRSFGAERAAWVAKVMKPLTPGDFPDLIPKADSWTKQPVTNILPDAFIIYAYGKDGSLLTFETNPVPDEVKIGIDPQDEELSFDQQTDNGLDNELTAHQDVKWMIDFDAAIDQGLAARIPLSDSQFNLGFRKILVLGVKSTLNTEDSQNRLERLIDNHHYTDGFSLLKQGTNTNNTETEYAGYSFKEYSNKITFKTEQEDPLFTPTVNLRQKSDGQILCEALGIEYELLEHIFQSNGNDINSAMNINNVLYQVSFGYFANELFPLFDSRTNNNTELKSFFTDFLRSRGALPSIRSGKQPYGILPTSVFSRLNWDGDPKAGLYRAIQRYTSGIDTSYSEVLARLESTNTLNAESSSSQKLMDVLSASPLSTSYVQRVGLGPGYVWNNLQYASIEFDNLRFQWQNEQLTNVFDKIESSHLPIQPDHKGIQINYLPNHSSIDIPLVAGGDVPTHKPLPAMGDRRLNMLQLLNTATFDELSEENYENYGIPADEANKLNKSVLYRLTRQSLMLEFFEAACELLNIPEDQRMENELINIIPEGEEPVGEQGQMGKLSYGKSRLEVMAQPFQGYESVAAFLSSSSIVGVPEAQNLLQAKTSLNLMARATVGELGLLTAEVIDAGSYRIDTWRLSMVNQRLNALRGIEDGSDKRTKGLYLGAYGWLHDIVRNKNLADVPSIPDGFHGPILKDGKNKGHIHAPSISQAVNGAVLRSGYTDRATVNMEDPLSVNLSSQRVRHSLDLLEGIKNGQQLGVLLGYELERRLQDNYDMGDGLNTAIMNLRKFYSQSNTILNVEPDAINKVKARNVINGIKIIEEYKEHGMSNIEEQSQLMGDPLEYLETEIKWIWNLMDAVADIAMAEGMFHIVQGNPVKGGAVTEAISKGKVLAEPDVVDSIKSGLSVNQRFTLHLNPDAVSLVNAWDKIDRTPRSMAEPHINHWLSEILPSPEQICCMIKVDGILEVEPVTVIDLGIQAIDLLYTVNEEMKNDDATLSLIIKKHFRSANNLEKNITLEIIYDPELAEGYAFAEILPILLYARKVITQTRNLDTHDYLQPEEADGVLKIYDAQNYYDRIKNAKDSLEIAVLNLQDELNNFTFSGVNNALYALNAFGIEQTIYEFIDENQDDEDTLNAWANTVLGIANKKLTQSTLQPIPPSGTDAEPFINHLKAVFKIIFDPAFTALPLFEIRTEEQAYLSLMVNNASTLLDDQQGNALLMEEWLGSISKVRKNTANFHLLSILSASVNPEIFDSRPIIPLQVPYSVDGTERWLGASVSNEEALKEGRTAIGASIAFPENYSLSGNHVGIMIDDWIDVIPEKEVTTGVALHHNQPNAKAPQCLILGLTPEITGSWNWDDIVDMMNETFDLAKKRGLTYETISDTAVAQIHPAIAIPFSFSGNLIGLTAKEGLFVK